MADHKIPSIIVDTPLGPMNAHFNNASVIVFNQSAGQVLTVNRVEYRCYFNAELKDGTWQIANVPDREHPRSTLNLNRAGSYAMYDYTHAAWQKAETVLSEWLPKWAAEQTLLLAEAEVNAARRAYEATQITLEVAYEAVKVAETEESAAIERCNVAEKHLLELCAQAMVTSVVAETV